MPESNGMKIKNAYSVRKRVGIEIVLADVNCRLRGCRLVAAQQKKTRRRIRHTPRPRHPRPANDPGLLIPRARARELHPLLAAHRDRNESKLFNPQNSHEAHNVEEEMHEKKWSNLHHQQKFASFFRVVSDRKMATHIAKCFWIWNHGFWHCPIVGRVWFRSSGRGNSALSAVPNMLSILFRFFRLSVVCTCLVVGYIVWVLYIYCTENIRSFLQAARAQSISTVLCKRILNFLNYFFM